MLVALALLYVAGVIFGFLFLEQADLRFSTINVVAMLFWPVLIYTAVICGFVEAAGDALRKWRLS